MAKKENRSNLTKKKSLWHTLLRVRKSTGSSNSQAGISGLQKKRKKQFRKCEKQVKIEIETN